MIRRILLVLGFLLLVFLTVLVLRTLTFDDRLVIDRPDLFQVGAYHNMASNLSQAIAFRTVSQDETNALDSNEFYAFIEFLEEKYPLIHGELELRKVNDFSLLYRWEGSGGRGDLPILLAAHYDVVPADESGESGWKFPPFSGAKEAGYLWGRGALDDKQSVIGIMEAVENLLENGFKPERDIYIAFGHDEEVGGSRGALAIATLLEEEGVRLEFTLDEGLVVTRGMVPGVERDVAMIGVSEKGFATVKLTFTGSAGHSAMPGKKTTIGSMSEAIVALEKNQMSARLIGPVRQFLQTVASESGFFTQVIFANLWLFEGLVLHQLKSDPLTASMVRTTTAPTIVKAGNRINVIPERAEAYINFRLLPGDSSKDVIRHVKEVLQDDRFQIEVLDMFAEASPVSSSESEAFFAIATTIKEIFPDALVTANLMNAVADARHYTSISDNVYRFAPMVVTPDYLSTIHGVNERIAISELDKIPAFYERLITRSAG